MHVRLALCRFCCTALLLAPCHGALGAALPDRIVLTVSDALGVKRIEEAVCSGVPFAKGALRADESMHVEAPDGKAVPTQTKVLGCWPDGSVRWLLVQFPAACAPNAEQQYGLLRGKGPAPAAPLVVDVHAEAIVVDTGPLLVTVPKTAMTVLGDVRVRRTGAADRLVLKGGEPMTFVLEGGSTHSSRLVRPEAVTIEETGPVRATVRIVGWLEGPEGKRSYKLDTRLRFYAGSADVQAEYTFICLGRPAVHRVKEISVDLRPESGGSPHYILPGDGQATRGALADGATAAVDVDAEMVCRVGLDGSMTAAKNHLDGWGVLASDASSVGVAVRDFRHLGPKAIEFAPGHIKLALWSPRAGKILNLGRTRAKTHFVLYRFGAAGSEQKAIAGRVRAFGQPLVATVDPAYFCTTDALGALSPAGVPETEEYDAKTDACFAVLREQRETMVRENGMLHYGDYYHGGYGNKLTRGDLEYDTAHAAFLLYARSGRRDYYDFAVACNQHFIDMDVNQETGDQRFHGYGDGAENHEAATTTMEWGHVFTDGPADAYYLTGNERSLEAVRMIADRVATIADGEGYEKIRGILAGAERQLGWPLLALCRAYEVTGDEKYLKASVKVVEYIKVYARNPVGAYANGTWWRSWMMDGCKVFMTGALHDGLSAYQAITHDDGLREAIVTSLDWLIDHMWNPEVDGFVYEFNAMNRKHRRTGMTGLNMQAVDAFRCGYEMTGDRRYLAVATRAFWGRVREMESEGIDGKQFSIETRTSPHTAAYFHREHLRADALPPAPKPVRAAPSKPSNAPRPEVLLRARFDGNLELENARGNAAGHAVNKIAFVPGKHGQAVAVGKGGYAWLPAPTEMLGRPGSIALWVQLEFKKQPLRPGQRAVFHVEGETPLVDSLGACTIYGDLRIRMKDHVGHLHGTAEGGITKWEPNEWHHVVVTWDEDRVKLYLDGVEQTRDKEGEYAGDGVIALPSGAQTRINLGWRFGNWYCPCAIDELVVYGRALSAERVGALFRTE